MYIKLTASHMESLPIYSNPVTSGQESSVKMTFEEFEGGRKCSTLKQSFWIFTALSNTWECLKNAIIIGLAHNNCRKCVY